MSDDDYSIKRIGGARRPPVIPVADYVSDASEVDLARPLGASAILREIETSEVLIGDFGSSLDLRLFERMNPVLVSPAVSSLTHRANVLHSVVSWLDAQSLRISQAQGVEEGGQHPWLGSVIETLREEIAMIELFHKGVLTDVGRVD